LYQVMVDRRDEVMVGLNLAQVYPGVHYRDNTLYAMYADQPPCPRARRASDRVISLPLHMQMDHADVDRVCDALKAVV
jgi:dTDP-4-amino-4,6-dideoxygalactose transaminase